MYFASDLFGEKKNIQVRRQNDCNYVVFVSCSHVAVLYLRIRCTHFICPSCVEPPAIAGAVLLTLFVSDMALFTVTI